MEREEAGLISENSFIPSIHEKAYVNCDSQIKSLQVRISKTKEESAKKEAENKKIPKNHDPTTYHRNLSDSGDILTSHLPSSNRGGIADEEEGIFEEDGEETVLVLVSQIMMTVFVRITRLMWVCLLLMHKFLIMKISISI